MSQDNGKKRKRLSNGIDSPNKRSTHSNDISVKHLDTNTLQPVIAVSKGIKPPTIPFKAYTKQESIILHSSDHPRLDYTATSYGSNDELSHYIAIFDPNTNSLEVTPAYHTQLQCVLRTAPIEDSIRKTIGAQRIALGQEFGTKKAKKAIESRTVNAITTVTGKDDVQAAILEEVAEQTGKEELVDLAAQLASKPIPKPNIDATAVEDVYTIGTLIPPADMRLLDIKEWQQKARAEENIPQHHRFVAYRVSQIGKSTDVSRLKALRYLGLLLQFNDALVGGRIKKVPKKEVLAEKLSDYPETLVDSVRRRFSVDKNELGKWQLENLLTHICALSLFVDQWSSDTTNIKDDLKLDAKTTGQYFTELGCKIGNLTEKEREARRLTKVQAAQVKMARLKLPLEFPKMRTGRRK